MTEPVVVLVGGWEHQCCGLAAELGDVVEYAVVPTDGPGNDGSGPGAPRYFEDVHHDTVPTTTVRGRVIELFAVGRDGRTAIRRVPGGRALRGFDDEDDGHLEEPWTGEVVTVPWDGDEWFEVVIDPSVERPRH